MLRTPSVTRRAALVASTSLLLFSACGEDETTGPPAGNGGAALNEIVTTAPINASSNDSLVYYSLSTNAIVPRTGSWDIALRRYEIRLNGGVTGSGGVTGLNIANNKTATSAQVLAFTGDNTRPAFDSLRAAQIPADTSFKSDRLFANPNGYLNLAGVPTANTSAYWKVKTATGAFALMRVTAITLNPQFALTSVSFETRTQTGTTLGAPQAFTVPTAGTLVNVSIATGGAVTANGCNWDVVITPASYQLGVNAACSAGTNPGPASPNFAAATSASDATEYVPYLAALTGPVPNSITDTSAPFRYNLSGDNRLSPSFNTYLVKNGPRVYKLQVLGYYSAAGASGYPTLRFARIQ
jgi:HmuY protein